jgi:hypothetical protein
LIAWLRVIYWTAFPAFPRFCFFPMVAAVLTTARPRHKHRRRKKQTSWTLLRLADGGGACEDLEQRVLLLT